MDNQISGTWEEFEVWIRTTIEGDFCWRIRPRDDASNRQMVADLILDSIKRNNGTFPKHNSFIQCEVE